jgi:hypothetical protein
MALSSTKSIDARAAQSRKLLEQHGVNVEDELFILVDESFTAWRADADCKCHWSVSYYAHD